jgi:hypothetical protein
MQKNCLRVSEFAKVKALLRWGRAQVLLSGEVEDGPSVRRKIENCLNYVRFFDLEHQEFAQLCRWDLLEVLSADEKCRIFESICLSDAELMPLHFRSPGPCSKMFLACALPYKENQLVHHNAGYPLKSELQFEVDVSVQLVGLQHFYSSVNPHVAKANFDSFCFQVRKTASLDILAGGTSADKFVSNGNEIFKLSPRCNLDPGTKYSMDLFFTKVNSNAYYLNYNLEVGKSVITYKGLTLKMHSNVISANVTKLVFKYYAPSSPVSLI